MRSLHSKGLSHKVQSVFSTNQRIIDELPIDLASKFAAILTCKYACSKNHHQCSDMR